MIFNNFTKNKIIKFEKKYKIDLMDKVVNKTKELKKKLVKLEILWMVMIEYYKKELFNEIIKLPIYVPNKKNIININKYINDFKLNIDYDIRLILSNILYLFTNYVNNKNELIIYYINRLIDNNDNLVKDVAILQELIIRSMLIIISKLNNINIKTFLKIFYKNVILKEIIFLSFYNYKKIILSL